MRRGNTGIGTSKHRKSGHVGKSPRFRHGMKRDAEDRSIKRKSRPLKYNSVADALKARNGT